MSGCRLWLFCCLVHMAAYRPPRTSRSSCLIRRLNDRKGKKQIRPTCSCCHAQFSFTAQTRMPRFHWPEQVSPNPVCNYCQQDAEGHQNAGNSHSRDVHRRVSQSKSSGLSQFLDCPSVWSDNCNSVYGHQNFCLCFGNLQLSQHSWVSTKNGDFNSYLQRTLNMKTEKSGNWQPDTITMPKKIATWL